MKLLCERRAGELLAELPRAEGGPGGRGSRRKASTSMGKALEEAGIAWTTADRWQQLAEVPVSEFQEWLAEANAEEASVSSISF